MFPPGQGATIGVDFMIKTVEIDGEKIKVTLINNYIAYYPKILWEIVFSEISNFRMMENIFPIFPHW